MNPVSRENAMTDSEFLKELTDLVSNVEALYQQSKTYWDRHAKAEDECIAFFKQLLRLIKAVRALCAVYESQPHNESNYI
jgi:hypothetical protein